MDRSDDMTQLLKLWQTGDKEAEAKVAILAERELKKMVRMESSRKHMAYRTTEMYDELFLRLMEKPPDVDYKNRRHFYAICARIFRQILADAFRNKSAQKRGSGLPDLVFDAELMGSRDHGFRVGDLSCALEDFEKLDPLKARVVDLKFYGGLTTGEIAEEMQISEPTVKRYFKIARTWLYRYLTETNEPGEWDQG